MAVYFIQDEGGEIKIGFSEGNPYRRLNTFRTGNPRELKLLVSIHGGREEEQALHERFADLRTRGEWFKPEARLLGFIEGMRYAHADKQPEPVDEDELSLPGLDADMAYAIKGIAMGIVLRLSLYESYRRAEKLVRDGIDHGGSAEQIESILDELGSWMCGMMDDDPVSAGISSVISRHEMEDGQRKLTSLLSRYGEIVEAQRARH